VNSRLLERSPSLSTEILEWLVKENYQLSFTNRCARRREGLDVEAREPGVSVELRRNREEENGHAVFQGSLIKKFHDIHLDEGVEQGHPDSCAAGRTRRWVVRGGISSSIERIRPTTVGPVARRRAWARRSLTNGSRA
jgi:hypothetical protein